VGWCGLFWLGIVVVVVWLVGFGVFVVVWFGVCGSCFFCSVFCVVFLCFGVSVLVVVVVRDFEVYGYHFGVFSLYLGYQALVV